MLLINVKNMELKVYLFQNIFRLHLDFINAVKNALKLDCVKYGYNFIKYSNILPGDLWQDGLHLNNSGKVKLMNKFLISSNKNYFFNKGFAQ